MYDVRWLLFDSKMLHTKVSEVYAVNSYSQHIDYSSEYFCIILHIFITDQLYK